MRRRLTLPVQVCGPPALAASAACVLAGFAGRAAGALALCAVLQALLRVCMDSTSVYAEVRRCRRAASDVCVTL
jgi:hypothetical protein